MRRIALVAASAAALACLGACSDSDDVADAAPTAVAIASAEPTPLDPFAWSDIPYEDYLEAADQIGLRRDVLVPETDFSAGLDSLCHTSADDLAALRKTQMANTSGTDTYTTAKYLGDEVGLRIGMACPQRMADWSATDADMQDDDSSDDEVSTVTDEDLARAEAEEAAASHGHSYDHDYSSASTDSGSDSDADSADDSDDSGVETAGTGGVTGGNSAPAR